MTKPSMTAAVIGGGIGGVSTAVALRQKGINAHVYEQAPAIKEVGAGVALHPNGGRMLKRLGLGDEVARVGARWDDPQFRHFDGRLIAPWFPANMTERPEIYGMHRADLLQMLLDRVPADHLHPDHRCISIAQTDDCAVVRFANGTSVRADVVVGADGIHSTVQGYITQPSPPMFSRQVAYRGIIPAASVDWQPGVMRNFLGPHKHFLVFPVRAHSLINYVGFIPSDEHTLESWSASGDPAALARAFAGWDPIVEEIIANVKNTYWWGLYDREPLPVWTRGRVTLLGDAAHPMLPHVGQGANQAIEDAVVLATMLADADAASAPEALHAYESVRRPRTARVQAISRWNGSRYDASDTTLDLGERDRQLSNQARDRAWMWECDAAAEAEVALSAVTRL
ncbi:MAG: FAD-dependent monooxygenase [Chloroflexota bacterium]